MLKQLYEQYCNFIADHVLREIKNKDDTYDKEQILIDFLKRINKNQAEFLELELMMMNRRQKVDFFDNLEEEGLYLHIPPFVGNVQMEDLVKLFKDHPEWCELYKCENIENPLVIGDEYFIRLKHQASNKTSIRSKGMLNIKNMPSKSALKKEKKAQFNDNPLRFGEMEQTYMQITKRPDLVAKLLRSYSTSMEDRHDLVKQLVTAKDPMNISINEPHGKTITREILDNYLAVLEVKLEDGE